MKKIILFILIASMVSFADSARQFYLNKDYKAAKNSYLKLQQSSPNNFSYNYNLGASYYRLENNLLAKYYFLKALKVKPNNADTIYNLNLVNKQFIDKQFIFNTYWNHVSFLNIKTIFSILMGISCLILIAIYFGLLNTQSSRIKRFSIIGLLVIIMFNSLAILFLLNEANYAVVKSEKVQIYSGPSETQKPLFFAHNGAECKIIKSSAIWAQVQFPNGLKGWIKDDSLLKI